MDKIEGGILDGLAVNALNLTLTRSAIKMLHTSTWTTDKINRVHDLVICLTGRAEYEIDGEAFEMKPGRAMLIRAGQRFIGRSLSKELYTGVAQHFRAEVFGRMDLLDQLEYQKWVDLPRWDMIEPLARHYRESVPLSSTTFSQHHMFIVLLTEFIEAAFIRWKPQQDVSVNSPDSLSLSVMVAASQIAADPISEDTVTRVLEGIPYNEDYFRREFRKQVGLTPPKYQEFKRMERAMALLASGQSVKQAAAFVGYSDSYYFSRMFKRYIGVSPAGYKILQKRHQDGGFPRGEEDGMTLYPLLRPND
ncbi:AraC family transcriptional regulator [Martelella mediterranea]|uniref:AraC-like DNA-binding protein n=1 Tax=Martelella mediterranea TaxID=293089 RepID=A0A4R3NT81_9HYPH|nr:AraC family transcriptional regulator [Martelella mediterranea]TCT39543.1 AraC-like DNA-binding protein [Martelella mediterranea]